MGWTIQIYRKEVGVEYMHILLSSMGLWSQCETCHTSKHKH